jgi:hypothetical protein
MTDEEKTEKWQHCIDVAISRAKLDARLLSAETLIDRAGLVICPETVTYTRHMLEAIFPSGPILRDDPIPIEERVGCLVKVIFACADELDDESKLRALNAQRTWRVLREMYERNDLRTLCGQEARRFVNEDE